MNRLLSLLACLVLVASVVSAQVAIDRADVEATLNVPITSYQYDVNDNVAGSQMPDTTGLAAIIGGAPADFRSIVRDLKSNVRSVLKPMPRSLPGADSFATATHVEELGFLNSSGVVDSSIYRYARLDGNGLTFLGIAGLFFDSDQNGSPDMMVARYKPDGWTIHKFPVTTGSTWQSSFRQEFWVTIAGLGTIPTTGSDEVREYNVTRSTTLTTPAGSAPALVAHVFESISFPQAGVDIALERFSWVAESGMAVSVAFKLDNFQNRRRVGLNDVAFFRPEGSSSIDDAATFEFDNGILLGQNHPNPFVSSTTIPFRLQRPAHVRLSVFDALGRELLVVLDAPTSRGDHAVVLDAGQLRPGVYAYRLAAGSSVGSGRMLVTK